MRQLKIDFGTNILVTSVASSTGLNLSTFLNDQVNSIVGIDSQEVIFEFGKFIKSPSANSTDLFPNFLTQVKAHYDIDRIYLCNDHEIRSLSTDTSINNCSYNLVPKQTLLLFQNKTQSSEYMKQCGFDVPKICNPQNMLLNTKYFLKNNYSYHRPKYLEVFEFKGENIPDFDAQNIFCTDYIEGIEISVDCYLDSNTNILYALARKRLDIIDGISTKAEFIQKDSLIRKLKKVLIDNEIFGFSCSQFISNEQGDFFLEINTRCGGGLKLSLDNKLFSDTHSY